MISLDTNILFPAVVAENAEHVAAAEFVESLTEREDVAISEFILLELYGLLRNPVVLSKPLAAAAARSPWSANIMLTVPAPSS